MRYKYIRLTRRLTINVQVEISSVLNVERGSFIRAKIKDSPTMVVLYNDGKLVKYRGPKRNRVREMSPDELSKKYIISSREEWEACKATGPVKKPVLTDDKVVLREKPNRERAIFNASRDLISVSPFHSDGKRECTDIIIKHLKETPGKKEGIFLPSKQMRCIRQIHASGIEFGPSFMIEREDDDFEQIGFIYKERDNFGMDWLEPIVPFHSDVCKFIKSMVKPFDIIFLDLCGPYTQLVEETLHHICEKNLIKPNGIIALTLNCKERFDHIVGDRTPEDVMKEYDGFVRKEHLSYTGNVKRVSPMSFTVFRFEEEEALDSSEIKVFKKEAIDGTNKTTKSRP